MGTSGTTLCSEVVQTPRVSQAQGRHPATSPASLLCCSPHLHPCPCRRTHTPIPPGWAQGRGRRPWERVQSKGDQPPPSAAPLICSGQRTRCCLRNALLGPRCPELISRSSFPMKNYEPVRLLTLFCRSHYPAPNQTPSSPKVGTRPSCLPPLCPPSNSRGLGTEREIRIQGMTGSMSRGKPRIVTQTCLQIFCL